MTSSTPSVAKVLDLEKEDYDTFCGGPDVDRESEGMKDSSLGLKRVDVHVSFFFLG